METEIKVNLKQFLAQFFQNYNLQDDEDIFALGFVNSLFAMQLLGVRLSKNAARFFYTLLK